MKILFDGETAEEVKTRLASLTAGSTGQWGTMTPTQMLAHCSAGIAMALGEIRPPRVMIGRILGPLIRSKALGNDEPMRRNAPTSPELIEMPAGDFDMECRRLCDGIDRVVASGPDGCTTHPHPFFGHLAPEEWGNLMYKHLDHHLRQFGA